MHHVLPCEREPMCQVQVEGHPDILWHAFEQSADAVDRFFRASRLGSRLHEADVLMRRQIYRFLAGVMKEDEARLRAVHAALAALSPGGADEDAMDMASMGGMRVMHTPTRERAGD